MTRPMLLLALSFELVVVATAMPNMFGGMGRVESTKKYYREDNPRLYNKYPACREMLSSDKMDVTKAQPDGVMECRCQMIQFKLSVNCDMIQNSAGLSSYGPLFTSNQLSQGRADITEIGHSLGFGQPLLGDQSADLQCPFPRDGFSTPVSIEWLKRNSVIATYIPERKETIIPSNKYELNSDGTLTIKNVYLSDAGEYTCKVIFPEQVLRDYHQHVTSVGRVTIHFTQLTDETVLYYKIRWRKIGAYKWDEKTIASTSSQATLTGLESGATYEVQIIAVLPNSRQVDVDTQNVYTIGSGSGGQTFHRPSSVLPYQPYQPSSYQVAYNPISQDTITIQITTSDTTVEAKYYPQSDQSDVRSLQFGSTKVAVARDLQPNTAYVFNFYTSRNGAPSPLTGISNKVVTTLPLNPDYGRPVIYNPSYVYPAPLASTLAIDWDDIPYYNKQYYIRYKPSSSGPEVRWSTQYSRRSDASINVTPGENYLVEVYTLPYRSSKQPIVTKTVTAPSGITQDGHSVIPPLNRVPSPAESRPAPYSKDYTVPYDSSGSVELLWTTPDYSPTQYEIMYRPTGRKEQPPMVIQVSGGDNSGIIRNLRPLTQYTIRVTPYLIQRAQTPIEFSVKEVSTPAPVIQPEIGPQITEVFEPNLQPVEPNLQPIERIETLPVDSSHTGSSSPIVIVEEPEPETDDEEEVPLYDLGEPFPVEPDSEQPQPIRPVYQRHTIAVTVTNTTDMEPNMPLHLKCLFNEPNEVYFVQWKKTSTNGVTDNLLNSNRDQTTYSISSFSQDDSGTYECSMFSTNYVGSGRIVIHPSENVPDPMNPIASDVTSTGFRLSWTQPQDWTQNDRFRVSYKPLNTPNAQPIFLRDRPSLNQIVTNLRPRTHYEVTVQTVRGASVSPGATTYIVTSNEIDIKQGELISILCGTTLTDPRRIVWYKDDVPFLQVDSNGNVRPLSAFKNRIVVEGNYLKFYRALPEDDGVYKCRAEEGRNVEELITKVNVDTCEEERRNCYGFRECGKEECQKYPNAKCIENYCFSCHAVQFYSLASGEIYDDTFCGLAETESKYSSRSDAGGAPVEPVTTEAPEIPIYPPQRLVIRTASTRALASWQLPRERFGTRNYGTYEVSYYPVNSVESVKTATVRNRLSYKLVGLTPDTAYHVDVKLIEGPRISAPVSKNFKTRPGTLSPPNSVRTQNIRSDSFDVVFAAENYPVTIRVTSGGQTIHTATVPPRQTRYMVPNLTPTTEYKIEVWKTQNNTPSPKRTIYQETIPATPTNVQAAGTPSSLTVSWDDDTTGFVTHYAVTYEPIDDRGNILEKETTKAFVEITGLNPDTGYDVRVIAHSRNRFSLPNKQSFKTLPVEVVAPDIPFITSSEVLGDSIEVFWAPDDKVDSYELTFDNELDNLPAQKVTILQPGDNSKELTNLKAGPYRASLTAVNKENGLRSAPKDFTFAIPIEPVFDVRVTDKSSDVAAVTWGISPTAVSDDTVEYKVEVTESGSGFTPIVKYTFDNTVTVEGLTAGTEYDVTVTAVIPYGEGIDEELRSEPAQDTFTTNVPKPSGVVVQPVDKIEEDGSPVTSAQIKLAWTPVEGADGYEVTYYPGNHPNRKEVMEISSPSETTVRIDNLDYNTQYVVEVASIFDGVKSEPSEETVTTKLAPTGSLEATVVDDDGTGAPESSYEVVWDEVPDASGYYIRYSPVDAPGNAETLHSNWYDDTTVTIENLEPSTTYNVQVVPYITNREGNPIYGQPNTIFIETPLPAPTAPVVNVETDENSQSSTVNIGWEDVPNANQYEVKYYPIYNGVVRGRPHTVTLDGSSPSVTLDRLQPGADYEVVVTPLNTDGAPGKTLVLSTSTPLPAPEEFTTGVTTEGDSATINVNWADNVVGGTKDFEIVYYPTDEPSNSITTYAGDSDSTNVVLDDILPGKRYTVEITPLSQTNKRGNTATSTVITPLDLPSSIETNTHENTIEVRWGRPTADVTNFEISATPINKPGQTVRKVVPAHQQTVQLIDLLPETKYLVSVVAQNKNLGLTSQPLSTEETTGTTHNVPEIQEYAPIHEPNEDGQYLIEWDQPKYLPLVYRVIWRKTDEGVQQENLVPNTNTSLKVDLEPNSNYRITIQALMSTDNPMKNPDAMDSVSFDVETPIPDVTDTDITDVSDTTSTITWDEPIQSEFIDTLNVKLFDVRDNAPISEKNIPVSDETITYEGLAPDTTYRVVITPVMGTTEGKPTTQEFRTAPLTTVPQVKNLQVLEKNPTAIVVGWQPATKYSPTYRLVLRRDDGSEIVQDLPNTANSYTFTNLRPATNYTVSISAVVNGIESEPAERPANTPLRKPENLQPFNVEDTDVSIRWQHSPDRPNYYRINLRPDDNPRANEKQFDISGRDNEVHITTLAPDTTYTVSIRALDTNLKEYSDPLIGTLRTSPAATTPSPTLEGTEVFTADSKIATIEWEPSTNPLVSGYNVVYTDSNDVTKTVIVPKDINVVMIEDLRPNTKYSVYVNSFLDTGEPEPVDISDIKSAVLPDTVTYNEVNGEIESAPSSGEVIVRWNIPEGTPVDSVILSYNNNGVKEIDLPSTSSQAIIRNLEPGDRYPIQVSYLHQGIKYPVETTEYAPVPTDEMLIQWDIQRGDQGYIVRYNERGSNDVEEVELPSKVNTITLTDLKPSADYDVSVTAIRPRGETNVHRRQPTSEPDKPRTSSFIHSPMNPDFELDDEDTDLVKITWNPPTYNPTLVTNYKIVLTPTNNPNAQTIETYVPASKTTHFIKGLLPQTSYNVSIISANTLSKIYSEPTYADTTLTTGQTFPLGPGQDDRDQPSVPLESRPDNRPNFNRPGKKPRPLGPEPGSAPQTGTQPQEDTEDGHEREPEEGQPDDETRPRPGTTDDETRPRPGTTDDETRPRPGTTDDDTAPRPGTTDDETRPRPGTTDDDTAPRPGTTDDDTAPRPGTTDDMEPEEETDFPYIKEEPHFNRPSGADTVASVGVVPIRGGNGTAGFNWGTTDEPDSYVIYYKRTDEPDYTRYIEVDKNSPVVFFPTDMVPNIEYDFRIDGVTDDLPNDIGFYDVTVTKSPDDTYTLQWSTQDDWNQRYGQLAFKPNAQIPEQPEPVQTLPSGLADDEEDEGYSIVPIKTTGQPHIIPDYTQQVDNEYTNWVQPIETFNNPNVASPTTLQLLWSPGDNYKKRNKYYHLQIQPVTGGGDSFSQLLPANMNRTISGLLPGVAYHFIVRDRETGEIISNFSMPAYTTSGRELDFYNIADVHVREIMNHQLLVSWPHVQGAVKYILEYNLTGTISREELNKPLVVLPRLAPGGLYELRVIAVIDDNEIPIYRIRIQHKYVGPPTPRSVEYRTSSYSMITLYWQTVPDEIDGYRLRLGMEEIIDGVPTMVEPIKETILPASTTTFEINDLVPGNQYQITLESFKHRNNKLYYSGPIVLHVTVPVPTVTRYLFSQSKSALTVRWNQIQIKEGDVQYEVSIRSPTGILVPPTLIDETEFTVKNLQPGIQYTFMLRTKFGDKYSKYSELTFWLVETEAQLQTLYRGPGTWDVTWSGDSSLVDHWKVQAVPLNQNYKTITFDNINRNHKHIRLTGLQPRQQYTVNVYGVRGNVTSLPISSKLTTSGQTTHSQVSQNIVTENRIIRNSSVSLINGGFKAVFVPIRVDSVDMYQIKYKLTSESEFRDSNYSASGSPTVINVKLPPGSYNVEMRPFKSGVGGLTYRTSLTLTIAPPSALSYAMRGGLLYIKWNAAPYTVENYQLSYKYTVGGSTARSNTNFVPASASQSQYELQVPMLTAGTVAEYSLIALTSVGESKPTKLKLRVS